MVIRGIKIDIIVKLTVILIQALLISFSTSALGQETGLKIIYTGSLQGQLEPCGCSPKTDFGGIARISGYLSSHKNELSPYILLDAGNFSAEDTPQGRLKTETMLNYFRAAQYDAVALSEKENGFPQQYFPPLLEKYGLPVVAGSSKYRRSLAIKRDRFDINVSADPNGFEKGKLDVLLTGLPLAKAKLINGWDLIITSSNEELDEPVKKGGTIIVSGYPKGKKLGILTIKTFDGEMFDIVHRWESIGNDIKEDKKVRNLLNDYDKKVALLLKESEQPAVGATYEGVAGCAECHQPFEESWKATRHAGAFSTLVSAGKSADPECLVCHTVGFGEDGGFSSIETTPELANVQCEVCHGPDKEHRKDFSRPMQIVTEAVCVKCHTKDNSPDFDYPVYLNKIKH